MPKMTIDMAAIEIFKNESFGEVRVAGTSEEPLFCLADVCRVLEIKNVADCKSRLDQRGVVLTDTPTHNQYGAEVIQKLVYINEKNLYKVIMRSDKPQAEPFQDWVCGEVLPTLRKTGQYSVQKQYPIPRTFSEALRLAADQQEEIEEQRKMIEAKDAKIAKDKPKVIFAEAVSTSQRSCLIAELAKILKQNGVNIGQNRLFEYMRKHGYLCSKGQYYNQPTQRAQELGLFEIKQTTINKPDGSILVSTTTKVTGKGQIYFVNKFLNDANVGRAAV